MGDTPLEAVGNAESDVEETAVDTEMKILRL